MTRKLGNAVSPVVDLQKEGEEYVLSSISTFKNVVLRFKPGVEFDQETPDGRKVKATFTVDGNTLHEVQKNADGKETTIDRTFTDDEIKMVSFYVGAPSVRGLKALLVYHWLPISLNLILYDKFLKMCRFLFFETFFISCWMLKCEFFFSI